MTAAAPETPAAGAPESAAVRSMRRYQVDLDGPTVIRLTGDPLAVAAPDDSAAVEFWAEHNPAAPEVARTFTVVGTGHPVPGGARYVGTAPRTRYGLVWHLYELTLPGRTPRGAR